MGSLSFDFETWEELLKGFERVWKGLGTWEGSLIALVGFSVWIGKGSWSWIWIGRVSFVEKLNFQAVIKSAASAASPKTKIQESGGA